MEIDSGNPKGRRRDVLDGIKHFFTNKSVTAQMIENKPELMDSTMENPFRAVLSSVTDGARTSRRTTIITATCGFTGLLGSIRHSPKLQIMLAHVNGSESKENIVDSLFEVYQDLLSIEKEVVCIDMHVDGKIKKVYNFKQNINFRSFSPLLISF